MSSVQYLIFGGVFLTFPLFYVLFSIGYLGGLYFPWTLCEIVVNPMVKLRGELDLVIYTGRHEDDLR